MVLLEWSYYPSGLGIRKDDFSWQASYQRDQRFFLRRSLDDLSAVTDILVGDQGDDTSAKLFSEFLWRTGGIATETLTLNNIANRSDKPDVVVSSFDCITAIAKRALGMLDVTVADSHLQENGRFWDAVIRLSIPDKSGSLRN
ncbi:hypothetical protein FGK63_20310 [Ruegeria sediminis]|uniref:Uncharacterized protein n=1 Tax=Ruegeria sediminis TaxID=2583820 RepID=A0ABY2WS30_9RHOB|nr:hypothetical protein [Ruegeria sediminis]TMV02573.1 hypothetical protein FGK63_20310 [Ruegeria sediminis]